MTTVMLGIVLCIILLCQLPTPSQGSRMPRWGTAESHCQPTSWEYHPSRLEAAWVEKVKTWDDKTTLEEYCTFAKQFQPNVSYWLKTNAHLMSSRRTHMPHPHGADVFSSFKTTYNCRGHANVTHTSWIEPLSFALRFPIWDLCDTAYAMVYRDYLLLASALDYHSPHPSFKTGSVNSPGGPRAFLFDLGASLWSAGTGGPSQSFIISAYRARGINFDRILMWEASPHTAEKIFDKVPLDLHAVYQYMNIPASTGLDNPSNPLNILKKITGPDDFVAFKLDIDTPPLENDLVQQILSDPEIYSRIDEFFFEHHVNFKPMVRVWGPTNVESAKMLHHSYDMFIKMRNLGIRAHGWP